MEVVAPAFGAIVAVHVEGARHRPLAVVQGLFCARHHLTQQRPAHRTHRRHHGDLKQLNFYILEDWSITPGPSRPFQACWESGAHLKLLAQATDMWGRKEVHRGSPLLSLAVMTL